MRQMWRSGVLAGLALLVGGGSAIAAPAPETNPNALVIEFDCGATDFTAVTIFQNAAVSLQVLDGPGAVAQMVELRSYTDAARSSGERLWFTTPGFTQNGHALLSCQFVNALYPDLYWKAEMAFRPPA